MHQEKPAENNNLHKYHPDASRTPAAILDEVRAKQKYREAFGDSKLPPYKRPYYPELQIIKNPQITPESSLPAIDAVFTGIFGEILLRGIIERSELEELAMNSRRAYFRSISASSTGGHMGTRERNMLDIVKDYRLSRDKKLAEIPEDRRPLTAAIVSGIIDGGIFDDWEISAISHIARKAPHLIKQLGPKD